MIKASTSTRTRTRTRARTRTRTRTRACFCFPSLASSAVLPILAVAAIATMIFGGGRTGRRSPIGYADAFCTGRIIDRTTHTRRPKQKPSPSLLVLEVSRPGSGNGRGKSKNVTEMVTYLEKIYQNSNQDGTDSNSNSNSNRGKQSMPFQTPVTTYTNALDLFDSIDETPPNELTVVLCFAHYCKTCHRANIPFKQLAYEHSGDGDGVRDTAHGLRTRFVRLETSALSPHQFRSLGIDRVPFVQIYRNGNCVASFPAAERLGMGLGRTGSSSSSRLVLRPRLLEALDACRRRSHSGWVAHRKTYAGKIEANLEARASLREDLAGNGNSNDHHESTEPPSERRSRVDRWYQSVRTLTSESDLLDLLVAGGDPGRNEGGEETVVVMVHSHFDPSCRRAQHKFRKTADERRRQQQQPRRDGRATTACTMARIEASLLSDDTLNHLGIQTYPHIQIYHRRADRVHPSAELEPEPKPERTRTRQCVASFSIPRSYLFGKLLHECLDAIDGRTPEEWEAFEQNHGEEIQAKKVALENILREQPGQHHRRDPQQ